MGQGQGKLAMEQGQGELAMGAGALCRGANSGKRGPREWYVEPTADGAAVVDALLEMPRHYPQVSILEWQLMPEHFHFVVFVREKLAKPLGALIRGFKAGAVTRWKSLRGSLRENAQEQDRGEPAMEQGQGERAMGQGCGGRAQAQGQGELAQAQGRGARAQAREMPAWSEGFVDTILWREGQLQAMLDYLADNPRRLAVKRADPALFRRVVDLPVVLHTGAAFSRSREKQVGYFSAIGNRFLLDRPIAQVQVSRRYCAYTRVAKPGPAADGQGAGALKIARDVAGEPIVAFETAAYRARRDELFAAAKHGAVLISPCVSDGERQIAREALAAGLKLITLSNKGFSKLQKPAGRLFDACSRGDLLMLAPAAWPYQPGQKPMTRFDATAMNRLCQWIAGAGAADVNYHGMRPANIDELALRAVEKG